MGTTEVEEVERVVESSISRIQWRLRRPSKLRLLTDILALYTRLRPVVMVDYGGKMPELQEHLCQLMQLAQKESSLLLPLRIMIIEDMIYIIHVEELMEYARHTTMRPLYVDLEEVPLKILSQSDKNAVVEELALIQELFSTVTPFGEVNKHSIPDEPSTTKLNADLYESRTDESSHCGDFHSIQSPVLMDLSSCMQDTHVTIPTLTGWLLGYPVVYLFGKDHISDAVNNLSSQPLNLYKLMVTRRKSAGREHCDELLMSFAVPYNLSMQGKEEPWAIAFLTRMIGKFERCRPAWASLWLEVIQCCPQAVVL